MKSGVYRGLRRCPWIEIVCESGSQNSGYDGRPIAVLSSEVEEHLREHLREIVGIFDEV